jgi:hypothetical protein
MKIDIGNLEFIDPLLRTILLEIENWFGEQTITSLYRIGDEGVHGTLPLRGTDLRCRKEDKSVGRRIEQKVNSRYIYDPARREKRVCMLHDSGLGLHLHIQVHPNTQMVAL